MTKLTLCDPPPHKTTERILVVGGGYIAVEFAGIFHGLGSKVCVASLRFVGKTN